VSTIRRTVNGSPWSQRLVALVLGGNVILILWGTHVVPAIVYPDGLGTTGAAILMQVAIAALAFFGPLSFPRYRASIGISLVLGLLFAVACDGILLSDFIPSLNIDFNVFLLFLGAASLVGFLAGYHTRSLMQGVVAAFWGSHQWFLFWQNDGAIDDFLHSGATNLHLFLLQDMQGALFFHPLLSAVVGILCGMVSSGFAQIILWLRRRVALHFAS
jgi:hypothetical protein